MNWKEQFDGLESRGQLFNGTDSVSRVEAKNLTSEIIEMLIEDASCLEHKNQRGCVQCATEYKLRDKWL